MAFTPGMNQARVNATHVLLKIPSVDIAFCISGWTEFFISHPEKRTKIESRPAH
jgi:hypothetical protein